MEQSKLLQFMKIQMSQSSFKLFAIFIVLASICQTTIESKCYNNSDFRYDLKEISQIINYNSLCFEYSQRTCCSPNNFQALAKKITKIIGQSYQLSHLCRRRLTNMLCSTCDGDIGQNHKEGVCTGYCMRLFEDCKQDYFSIDANNQLKVCREDDIICSKLKDIVADKETVNVCELLEQRTNKNNCWNGEISARIKGKAKKKVDMPYKPTKKTESSKNEPSWFSILSPQSKLFLFLISVLVLIFGWVYFSRRYALWKRQICNQ